MLTIYNTYSFPTAKMVTRNDSILRYNCTGYHFVKQTVKCVRKNISCRCDTATDLRHKPHGYRNRPINHELFPPITKITVNLLAPEFYI
jgi:hypothetical protein